jgi:hypothetical protein
VRRSRKEREIEPQSRQEVAACIPALGQWPTAADAEIAGNDWLSVLGDLCVPLSLRS